MIEGEQGTVEIEGSFGGGRKAQTAVRRRCAQIVIKAHHFTPILWVMLLHVEPIGIAVERAAATGGFTWYGKTALLIPMDTVGAGHPLFDERPAVL